MLKGFWKLENWNYIDSWDYFSRSLFLLDRLSESKTLIVVNSSKEIKSYKKVLLVFWIEINEISWKSSLANYIYSESWIYICQKELFEARTNVYEFKRDDVINIKKDGAFELDELVKRLVDFGYNYSEYPLEGEYNKKWDILTIRPEGVNIHYKISFWDDIVDYIQIYDNDDKLIKDTNFVWIWKIEPIALINWPINLDLAEMLTQNETAIIFDSLDFWDNKKRIEHDQIISFDIFKNFDSNYRQSSLNIDKVDVNNLDEFKDCLLNREKPVTVITDKEKLIVDFLDMNVIKNVRYINANSKDLTSFSRGIDKNEIYVCDDIINKVFVKKRLKKSVTKHMDLLLQIKKWDNVVHVDHGIWRFNWIVKKTLAWITKEYLEVLYLGEDKLFIPISEASRLVKYVWQEDPKLTSLKWQAWQRSLKKAEAEAEEMAEELLEIYAEREALQGHSFEMKPEEMKSFERSFPYEYTKDQKKVISEILLDMHDSKPMDRLLSWDVWFWKTEIAFNAIYNAFINWKQSAMISPLVVLAYEHYEKAVERFSEFWMSVDVLTRLEKPAKVKATLERLKKWDLDLVIWTHKLLSNSVDFKDLWLLVLDEEHKFWVKDKEKLKQYKNKIDVLSMSATPIPRSMNMALSWIRDISTLTTPPFWRKNTKTYITKFMDSVVHEACQREFDRQGQVFFIHNRVENIDHFAKYLTDMFPDKRVVVTHGQLSWDKLEDRILAFKRKEYDILVSTTVVENGVDFTNANTIIINEAYRFGLSQIHQLRWRVWRKDRQGYCYLTYSRDNISEDWVKRLKTLAEHSYLWAWFEIAMKDLEIRWGWDILWIKQSGQSRTIWVSTFLRMLEDKVNELRSNWIHKEEKEVINITTTIELNIPAYVPDDYFSSDLDKMNFYREVQSLTTLEELDIFVKDLELSGQEFDSQTKLFFNTLRLRIKAFYEKITCIKRVWEYYNVDFAEANADSVRWFLDLDKDSKFLVVSLQKVRTKVKDYESDEDFLNYVLSMFGLQKKKSKKIKLKK